MTKDAEEVKCFLCNSFKDVKHVIAKNGLSWPSCTNCIELGVKAQIERDLYGLEMNVLQSESFKNKPACSKIWLLHYCNITEMTKH